MGLDNLHGGVAFKGPVYFGDVTYNTTHNNNQCCGASGSSAPTTPALRLPWPQGCPPTKVINISACCTGDALPFEWVFTILPGEDIKINIDQALKITPDGDNSKIALAADGKVLAPGQTLHTNAKELRVMLVPGNTQPTRFSLHIEKLQ